MRNSGIELAGRLALRPKEAAAALGIGERTFRQLLPEIPHVRLGKIVLLPVDGLRKWLSDQTQIQCSQVDAVAKAILAVVDSREKD